jgi:hypothetical protein
MCISNLHLTARLIAGETSRMKEITNALSIWSSQKNAILAGDFNDDFRNVQGIIVDIIKSGYTIPVYRDTDMSCCTSNMIFRPDHMLVKGGFKSIAEMIFAPNIVYSFIPNLICPSDHTPIMQIIRINEIKDSVTQVTQNVTAEGISKDNDQT